MRMFGRVLLALPGLAAVVILAGLIEAVVIVIAIYDAILTIAHFIVSWGIWLVRYLLGLPFLPIRLLTVRWAYGRRLRDVIANATNGFLLTMMFRVSGRFPRAVAYASSDALADAYRDVPILLRLIYLRIPGSRSTRRWWPYER
jgi:hypothetical protein